MADPAHRAAVITVSDGVSNGTREDASGDAAEALLRAAGFDVSSRVVVPDERAEIERALRELAVAPRARRDHRRHRVRAARRHARGDEGRRRARGTRGWPS